VPTIDHHGDRIYYEVAGRGPWVLLLHSLGGSAAMWQSTVEHLMSDFTVVALDARGHGRSTGNVTFTIEGFAADAKAVADALGADRVSLVGLSMGGQTALRFALCWPERVAAVVAADTSAGGRGGGAERIAATRRRIDEIGTLGFAREYTASRLRPDTSPAVAEAFAQSVLQTLPKVYIDTFAAIAAQDLRAELPSLDVPTLVLVGADDVSTPPAVAAELRDLIAGARLEIIDDANHLANLDQPARFNAALAGFLKRVGQGERRSGAGDR